MKGICKTLGNIWIGLGIVGGLCLLFTFSQFNIAYGIGYCLGFIFSSIFFASLSYAASEILENQESIQYQISEIQSRSITDSEPSELRKHTNYEYSGGPVFGASDMFHCPSCGNLTDRNKSICSFCGSAISH